MFKVGDDLRRGPGQVFQTVQCTSNAGLPIDLNIADGSALLRKLLRVSIWLQSYVQPLRSAGDVILCTVRAHLVVEVP
jgi:hypothetical protein